MRPRGQQPAVSWPRGERIGLGEVMLITQRDEELLNWINRFGYVSIKQIADYWQVSEVTAYGRMKKLVSNEYLVHQRFLYQAPGLYWVSKKGTQLVGSQKESSSLSSCDSFLLELARLAKKLLKNLVFLGIMQLVSFIR